jgi:exopolyphosphatase/pppGpp-phosphohydrolase
VAVLVIPAAVEGRYGHDSAKQALGQRLQTSHILDIGGGSMQVAGHERSFGIELGQKSWAHLLCQTLGRGSGAACQLLPLQTLELQQARDLASQRLQALPAEVGPGTLTAISRPVTRGIRSALRSLGVAQGESISAQELGTAIDRLSTMALAEVVQLTGLTVNFAPFLVSDMLLVEAVMRAMNLSSLALAETAINNLPALLRDERAFAWSQRHPCYVQRLRELGPAAYFSDPAGCAKP